MRSMRIIIRKQESFLRLMKRLMYGETPPNTSNRDQVLKNTQEAAKKVVLAHREKKEGGEKSEKGQAIKKSE